MVVNLIMMDLLSFPKTEHVSLLWLRMSICAAISLGVKQFSWLMLMPAPRRELLPSCLLTGLSEANNDNKWMCMLMLEETAEEIDLNSSHLDKQLSESVFTVIPFRMEVLMDGLLNALPVNACINGESTTQVFVGEQLFPIWLKLEEGSFGSRTIFRIPGLDFNQAELSKMLPNWESSTHTRCVVEMPDDLHAVGYRLIPKGKVSGGCNFMEWVRQIGR